MTQSLVFTVRLHEGWYHGAGAIPSPARMFQALIAGRGLSGPFADDQPFVEAIEWLERQPPPLVATPSMTRGQSVANYVPNNDLDAKQGDHRRVGEVRAKKMIRPQLFDVATAFLYCWQLPDDGGHEKHVEKLEQLADGVYQLGRTVDAAWAVADVVSDEQLDDRLREHRGPVLRPTTGQGDVQCPTAGSLDSLIRRHDDLSRRFSPTADRKGQAFRRRSKPKWQMVSYTAKPTRVCYELSNQVDGSMVAWPLTTPSQLVRSLRDAAAEKLTEAMPDRSQEIGQVFIGRKPGGDNAGPISARVRIVPLPSIGHVHTDPSIRRVLVEVPSECPLRTDDVLWGFSGQAFDCYDQTAVLVPNGDHRQLEHYGMGVDGSRHWHTVTPIALSSAPRRRIEPDRSKRTDKDSKPASERRFEQEQAMSALKHALRHAGVPAVVEQIQLQREPFSLVGKKSDDFADGERFNKHTLWHASLTFDRAVTGPLLIGDGRFMGLGLMKPVPPTQGVCCLSIESGLSDQADPIEVAEALRRAVMACVHNETGSYRLDPFFTGHNADGSPTKSKTRPHLAFLADLAANRLLIVAPSLHMRHAAGGQAAHWKTLESAVQSLTTVRAGRNGCLKITATGVNTATDPLFAPATRWQSVTPYTVNRHARRVAPDEIIRRNVLDECRRRGLPTPDVVTRDWTAKKGVGLQANLLLSFANHISGPILLGKTRHKGGGLFRNFTPGLPVEELTDKNE